MSNLDLTNVSNHIWIIEVYMICLITLHRVYISFIFYLFIASSPKMQGQRIAKNMSELVVWEREGVRHYDKV